ncbi:hypothetical protein MS3_00010851, partial [Schistosoma haematobium]
LTEKGFFAARWSLDRNKETKTTVTNLIYANGKISVYYDNILSEISENEILGIRGIFQCETAICPIHNSSEACKKATTPNITCIWCEKWNTCIDSNHQDHHFFKVNGCHYKSPDVIDVSTSTSINHKATTLGVREVQVDRNLKETTNGTDQYSSRDVIESPTSTSINHKAKTFGIPENEVGGNLNETTNGTDQYSNTNTEISQETYNQPCTNKAAHTNTNSNTTDDTTNDATTVVDAQPKIVYKYY